MTNIDQVFLYMKDEIERTAKAEEEAILDEVKVLEEEAYQSMQIEAKKDADLRLKQELDDIQSQASVEISESHIERTKKLTQKRDEYVSDVFNSARKKLVEFTTTDEYKDFMLKKAKKVSDTFKEDFILYVKANDMNLVSDLKKIDHVIDVKESTDIMIGGLIGENPNSLLVIDETLDFALKNQKEWFYQNSGLMIK